MIKKLNKTNILEVCAEVCAEAIKTNDAVAILHHFDGTSSLAVNKTGSSFKDCCCEDYGKIEEDKISEFAKDVSCRLFPFENIKTGNVVNLAVFDCFSMICSVTNVSEDSITIQITNEDSVSTCYDCQTSELKEGVDYSFKAQEVADISVLADTLDEYNK